MLKFCGKYPLQGKKVIASRVQQFMYISDIRPHQIQNEGSLNLAVGVSQNHHAVDLRKRWEKTNKNFTSYKMIIRFVFYFPVRLLLFRRRFFFCHLEVQLQRVYSTGHNNTSWVHASKTVLFFFFLLFHRKCHKPTTNYILSTADNPEPVR